MKCPECRDEGFVVRNKIKIIPKEIEDVIGEKITFIGGTDICSTCQQKSEASYLAQKKDHQNV